MGFFLSAAGVAAAIKADLGPVWYPAVLALTTLPCARLAAAPYRNWHAERRDGAGHGAGRSQDKLSSTVIALPLGASRPSARAEA